MAAAMRLPKTSPASLTIALLASVALWLSFAVLGIERDGPTLTRIGFLPPWSVLAMLGLAVASAVVLFRPHPATMVPFGLAILTLVPWIPMPIPRLFVLWSGHAVWLVWAAIAIVWLARFKHVALAEPIRRLLTDPKRARLVATAAALLVYAIAAVRMAPILPGGDEPHYLVIAQSLLTDADLQIENNHRRGDYRSYYPYQLPPDYLRRGVNGQIYSIHAPGLPAIVAPAFWLFGYQGARILLLLLTAWGAGLVWRSTYATTADAPSAWFGWAAVSLSAPFLLHSSTIYPDGLGAVVTMAIVAGIVDPPRVPTRWWWAGQGAWLALLPWLHTRFVLIAGVLGLVLLVRRWQERADRWGGLSAFTAPVALGVAAWLSYFLVIYQTLNPAAPYGGYTQTAIGHLRSGMPGLLFDQQFGLLANAPVYGIALIGLFPLARIDKRFAILLVALAAPYWMATASYRMWWGGSSAPARFLVAILLPLGIAAGALWKSARPATRTFAISLLLGSTVLSGVLVFPEQGALAFNERDGHARWLRWLSPISDVDMGVPSFFRDSPLVATMQATMWVAGFVAVWLVLRLAARRGYLADPMRSAMAAACLLLVCSTLALSAAAGIGAGSPVPVSRSQLEFLQVFNPEARPQAVTYDPLLLIRTADAPAAMEIAATPVADPDAAEAHVLWSGVPPGTYRLRFRPGARVGNGTVTMSIGPGQAPLQSWPLAEGAAWAFDSVLTLPVRIESLTLRADRSLTSALARATLYPQRLTTPAQRLTDDVATSAGRYGTTVVYELAQSVVFGEPGIYFESPGFWVTGGREAAMVFASASGQRIQRLLVRNGAAANQVSLSSGVWRQEFPMGPGQETTVDVPLASAEASVVRVRTSSGFRPSAVDPRSQDQRFLGCWIEIKG